MAGDSVPSRHPNKKAKILPNLPLNTNDLVDDRKWDASGSPTGYHIAVAVNRVYITRLRSTALSDPGANARILLIRLKYGALECTDVL
jgi:hypothetical protein